MTIKLTKQQKKKKRKALERAHEIRKFEIDLYWRRTTYFWTLIAAAFVAFFSIQSAGDFDSKNSQVLSFIVANLGFVFSAGWYFINRGSKFWQQNWEIHVDKLEKCLHESVYRLILQRTNGNCWLVDPGKYSVSKINQITSLYVTIVWVGLGAWSSTKWYELAACSESLHPTLCILILFTLFTIAVCIVFHCKGRTRVEEGDYSYPYSLVKRTPRRKR